MVISVWGGKGGLGKSTLSALLAWMLGKVGRTLLVDADGRQTDGSSSELHKQLTVEATYDLTMEEDPAKLAKLRAIRGYRFIVLDNAPDRDLEKLKVTCDGDLIVVPMVAEDLETKAVMSSLRTYVVPSGRPFMVVMNRVTHAQKGRAAKIHAGLDVVGIPTAKTHVRGYQAHAYAGAIGTPITEGTGQNWDKAREDAYNLVDEILVRLGQEDRVPRRAAT
ncbi:ParA family protein [Embleya sp. NPDC005971]|uniref:ParA family protein n=1 Tax=Embleya sp. NPDC005971 TaxID=3156724 RepID=UPI0033C0C547